MVRLSWCLVRNKPAECVEFAVVHENFAWRKHHSSRFGLLKNQQQRCANDSLSRAFASTNDSVIQLFCTEGNRTLRQHPEYGRPMFSVVWYASEEWAILCTETEATLIESRLISTYPRAEAGAHNRVEVMQRLWASTDESLKVPLGHVLMRIAQHGRS